MCLNTWISWCNSECTIESVCVCAFKSGIAVTRTLDHRRACTSSGNLIEHYAYNTQQIISNTEISTAMELPMTSVLVSNTRLQYIDVCSFRIAVVCVICAPSCVYAPALMNPLPRSITTTSSSFSFSSFSFSSVFEEGFCLSVRISMWNNMKFVSCWCMHEPPSYASVASQDIYYRHFIVVLSMLHAHAPRCPLSQTYPQWT